MKIPISGAVPRISIVTPSYNQGEYLEECIDSILGQHYPNLEYVIMDGGSTDNSVATIKKYAKHLTYWQSQRDDGQYAAITQGFAHTTGDVMAWLNSDDKYHRDALWRMAYTFSHYPEVDWFTGRHTSWDEKGNLASITPHLFRWSRQRFLDLALDEKTTFIQQESTAWRRRLWDQAGGYIDPSFDLAGDFELWLRFLRQARLYSLDALIAGYRFHAGQKVGHQRERYLREAATVLAREQQRVAAGDDAGCLSEPVPISLYDGAVAEFRAAVEAQTRGTAGGRPRGLESMTITSATAPSEAVADPRVVVATSIAPHHLDKQRAAIDSWRACGFHVVSLNVPAEIGKLRPTFPDVEFVPVGRDGGQLTGRPLVYFDDVAGYLRSLHVEVCGIVNSDIYLLPERDSVETILREARGSLVFGSRVDVRSLEQLLGPVYTTGFDFFFFDRRVLDGYAPSSFMLGMPWWDYWAPLQAMQQGFPIKYLESPFAYHVEHKRNYLDDNFLRLGREFAENLLAHYLRPVRSHFPSLQPTLTYEADINKLVPQVVQYLHASSARLRTPRLEIAAMNARGEAYLHMGEARWAEVWFQRTLEQDPRCLAAHNNLAVLYWNSGQVEKATEHLGIALEIGPQDRTTVLNCGAVLLALGKQQDAGGLYDNYLRLVPNDAEVRGRRDQLAETRPRTQP
jgi:hypothetical protein